MSNIVCNVYVYNVRGICVCQIINVYTMYMCLMWYDVHGIVGYVCTKSILDEDDLQWHQIHV